MSFKKSERPISKKYCRTFFKNRKKIVDASTLIRKMPIKNTNVSGIRRNVMSEKTHPDPKMILKQLIE